MKKESFKPAKKTSEIIILFKIKIQDRATEFNRCPNFKPICLVVDLALITNLMCLQKRHNFRYLDWFSWFRLQWGRNKDIKFICCCPGTSCPMKDLWFTAKFVQKVLPVFPIWQIISIVSCIMRFWRIDGSSAWC